MRIMGSGSGSVHWHLHVTLRFRDVRSKRRAVASRAKRKHAGARATLGARPVLRARRELRLAWTGRAERLLFVSADAVPERRGERPWKSFRLLAFLLGQVAASSFPLIPFSSSILFHLGLHGASQAASYLPPIYLHGTISSPGITGLSL